MTEKALILIVDDNPDNIHVLGESLKSTECNLSVAFSGKAALNMIEKESPSLILLDVMMPDINGFQVCEKLKSNPKTKDIEIIFITAAVNLEEELTGLSLGAVDYIHKPISIPIVKAKVALHLERIKSKKALAEVNRLREDIERMTQHDLKSPLTAIMCYSQMMIEDDDIPKEEKQQFLECIYEAGNKILFMVNNSLDLYKMETKTYECTPEPIALGDLIEDVIKDLQTLAVSDIERVSSIRNLIYVSHRFTKKT